MMLHYKPYALSDASGNAVTVSAGSYKTDQVLYDSRSPYKKILYLDSATNSGFPWILHGSIGITPPYLLMYPRFPSGGDLYGKWPELAPARPSSGDKFSYVSEKESPYDNPTDFIEYVIPPKLDISFDFYNTDSSRDAQPVLNLLFALYWFEVLTPERHARLIGKIAAREVPAAYLKVGFGYAPLSMSDVIRKEWRATPMSLEEAIAIGGVR